MGEPATVLADPFELVSIREVAPPDGAAGAHWHRYEIVQGKNTIVGYREGGVSAVTDEVENIVLQLNERRLRRRGRVHLVLQPSTENSPPSK